MASSAEEEFDAIATGAVERADRVECSPEVYRDGLREILDHITTALQASEETSRD